MKPQLKKFWSVKNCVLEWRKCSSPINNSKCSSHWNFHFCMKATVIAVYGCMSEGINCSLTQQQDRVWAERSTANYSVVIKKHHNCHCNGKEMVISFSLAHLCQHFSKGTVKCFVQYQIFTCSLPGPCPMINTQSIFSHLSCFCVEMFHLQYYFIAAAIHIQSLSSHIYAYAYIFFHNTEMLLEQKKKNWYSTECCIPRKSFCMPFWAHVPYIHQPCSILLVTAEITLPLPLYLTIFLPFHLVQKQ